MSVVIEQLDVHILPEPPAPERPRNPERDTDTLRQMAQQLARRDHEQRLEAR